MRRSIIKRPSNYKYVRAAEFGTDDEFTDAVDQAADTVEDLQDAVDDYEEDDDSIAVNTNISDHYIAECDKCHGIFISAVVLSDQDVESVTGVCPLCGKESDQVLKWVIKDIKDVNDIAEGMSEPEPEPAPESEPESEELEEPEKLEEGEA